MATELRSIRAIGQLPGLRPFIGSLAPVLLAGVALAGPLSRYLGWALNPSGADPKPKALELFSFAGIMALLLASLVGGTLVLAFVGARERRWRAVVQAVAWGLVPILVAFPVLVLLQVPPPANAGGPMTGLVVGILSPFLWTLALGIDLVAVLASAPFRDRLLAAVLLAPWFILHGVAISAAWLFFLLLGV